MWALCWNEQLKVARKTQAAKAAMQATVWPDPVG